MANLVGVVVADTHLANGAWVSHPKIVGDSYRAFEFVTLFAAKHKVPLFLAGDIFDVNRPDAKSVLLAQQCLNSVDSYFIQGQHELSDPPWLTLTRSVHMHDKIVTVGPFVFYGIDFSRRQKLLETLSKIPKQANALLMHQVWGDHLAGKTDGEAKFLELPDVNCVFTGDYHLHRSTEVKKENGWKLTVFSPGSTCMQAVDESDEKFFFGLYDDGTVKSLPIPYRRVIRVKISTEDCFEKFKVDIHRQLNNVPPMANPQLTPLIIARVRNDVNNIIPKIEKLADSCGCIPIISIIKVAQTTHIEVGSSFGNVSLLSCLDTDVDHDDPVYKTCFRLLSTTRSHDEEIKAIRAELLSATKQNEHNKVVAGSSQNTASTEN